MVPNVDCEMYSSWNRDASYEVPQPDGSTTGPRIRDIQMVWSRQDAAPHGMTRTFPMDPAQWSRDGTLSSLEDLVLFVQE
jgi:hypothetical protein